MPDSPELVTPEAAELLNLMSEEIHLPADWDVSGLWLGAAQSVAQFLADSPGKISLEDAAMLAGIGSMLIQMAKREREACAAAGAFLRGEGGAA